MTLRRILLVVAIAGLALALILHWLPGRQVRLHQRNFLHAVEDRNWSKVEEFLSPDYADGWGNDRQETLEALPQAFQDFLACGLLAEEVSLGRVGSDLVLRTRIRVVGSGGPIAQHVMNEASKLKEPFSFQWRRMSWKPWDWQLVATSQPELTL